MPALDDTLTGFHDYIGVTFAPEDEILQSTRRAMADGGLPSIAVSPSQGKLLNILAQLAGARRILEIGTLGGYSAIWLGRALPEGGRLISLELEPRHAEVARSNIARAGLAETVDIRVGPALDSLRMLHADAREPFDLIFIDADKPGYPAYLEQALPLLRSGGLLIADNTLPEAVLDPAGESGAKSYNTAVAAHPQLTSIVIPALRGRGVDGLTVSIKA